MIKYTDNDLNRYHISLEDDDDVQVNFSTMHSHNPHICFSLEDLQNDSHEKQQRSHIT